VTINPTKPWKTALPILVAHGTDRRATRWCDGFESGVRLASLSICRVHTRCDAGRSVEEGGLGAAVLLADDDEFDGLSVLRTIRSIDVALPCWLLTRNVTRRMLEVALALRATSVIKYPSEPAQVTIAVRNVLQRKN